MTEIVLGGKYQTRSGLPAEVVAVGLAHGNNPVAAVIQESDGRRVYLYRRDGLYFDKPGHQLDLVPIPEPPVMVPLGPEDVIPGVTLIRRKDATTLLLSTSAEGACYGPICSRDGLLTDSKLPCVTWPTMQTAGSEYSNDHGQTWSRCEKAVPNA